jgi:hypothetical protein
VTAGLCLSPFIATASATALWLAEVTATLAARPVAAWLEPEIVSATDALRRVPFELEQVELVLRAASRDPDLARAQTDRLEALAQLDRIEKGVAALADRGAREKLERGRVETLLGLGRLDEAEEVSRRRSPSAADEPALRAELARRRGDPEAAVGIALDWLGAMKGDDTDRGRSGRASALAIVALARADQGRLDEARASAGAAALVPWYQRSFEHLKPEAIDLYLEARRTGTRPASSTLKPEP